ncbi:MAG: secretin N-terminal domain-containing protein, partial [Gemmatimonadaceae bacterium]
MRNILVVAALFCSRDQVWAQKVVPIGSARDSVTIRLANTELRAAVQLLGQYLAKPVLFTGAGGGLVTLETPRPIARADVPRLLQSMLESQAYELVDDSAGQVYRARPRETPRTAPASQQLPPDAPRVQGSGGVEVFVIQLKHARSSDVASTVNALYGKATIGSEYSRRGTLGDELRQIQVPALGAVPSGPQVARPTNGFSGDVTIVPDTRANNLLIRANRTDYLLIESLVRQIDIRPLQVMIEVYIAEVRKDRSTSFGVDLELGETSLAHKTDMTGTASISGAGQSGLGDFAIKVMSVGGINLDATLRAVAGRGDVSVVSRPVILTTNNQEAEIIVGSQRPFVQVSRALPTEAAVRDQVVQYKDVGTKLTVRPSISIDGSVELEVKQEVSSATNETAFNAPVISTRSVQTQLLVRDGQTIVLGGLTDKQHDASQRGIPFLSAIPFIGGLFGHVSRQTTETELFIFLTPRVIR